MLTQEEEVVNGIRAGGKMRRVAENRLFDKLKAEFTRKGITKYRLSNEDATDAYMETIRFVISNIESGTYEPRPGKSLTGYAVTIFHNKCIDIQRRKNQKTEPIDESLADALPDDIKDMINAEIDAKGLRMKIHECYAKTGELCKKLLEYVEEGFTDKEIAERLSFHTKDGAKQKRYVCLRKLSDCLNLPKHG